MAFAHQASQGQRYGQAGKPGGGVSSRAKEEKEQAPQSLRDTPALSLEDDVERLTRATSA